jgi:hypothetical protein
MKHSDCEECRRLWDAYAIAIRTHISLEYKLRGVAMEGDLDQIQNMAQETDQADIVRADFRETIRNHEETAHRERALGRPSVAAALQASR